MYMYFMQPLLCDRNTEKDCEMQFKVVILLSDDKLFQYSFIIYSSVAMNVSQQVKKKKKKKNVELSKRC